jgi:leader peptidase (prepilin peptidase)/N-methyltransferase
MFALPAFVSLALLAFWSTTVFAVAEIVERRRYGTARAPSAAAFVAVAVVAGEVAAYPTSLAVAAVVVATIAAAEVDARRGYLFDAITLPMCAIALANALRPEWTDTACAGAILFGGTFAVIHYVSRGRAIGLGDVKVLFALGAAFGPGVALLCILVASISGSAVALVARLRDGRAKPIAFGPYLAFGAFVGFVAGPTFVRLALQT